MSSSDGGYCSKCGAELPVGSSFCPKCGAPIGNATQGSAQSPYYRRRREYRNEKYEKQEKHEKNEKGEKGRGGSIIGPVIGGLILIWLGLTFYLQQVGALPSENWWAYFVMGIGIIIILQGALLYSRHRRPIYGPFIGGAILFLVGFSFVYNVWSDFWPLIIVVIGIAILLSAIARSRTPAPS